MLPSTLVRDWMLMTTSSAHSSEVIVPSPDRTHRRRVAQDGLPDRETRGTLDDATRDCQGTVTPCGERAHGTAPDPPYAPASSRTASRARPQRIMRMGSRYMCPPLHMRPAPSS